MEKQQILTADEVLLEAYSKLLEDYNPKRINIGHHLINNNNISDSYGTSYGTYSYPQYPIPQYKKDLKGDDSGLFIFKGKKLVINVSHFEETATATYTQHGYILNAFPISDEKEIMKEMMKNYFNPRSKKHDYSLIFTISPKTNYLPPDREGKQFAFNVSGKYGKAMYKLVGIRLHEYLVSTISKGELPYSKQKKIILVDNFRYKPDLVDLIEKSIVDVLRR